MLFMKYGHDVFVISHYFSAKYFHIGFFGQRHGLMNIQNKPSFMIALLFWSETIDNYALTKKLSNLVVDEDDFFFLSIHCRLNKYMWSKSKS